VEYAIKKPLRFFFGIWFTKVLLFAALQFLDMNVAKQAMSVYGGIAASVSLALGLYFRRGSHPLSSGISWVLLAESAGLWTTVAFSLFAGVWKLTNDEVELWMRYFMFSTASLSSMHFALVLEMYLRHEYMR
jgi:hypothetical protein